MGTTTTTTTAAASAYTPVLHYRAGIGDRHGGIGDWREIVGTIAELTAALAVLWEERPDADVRRRLERAALLIVAGRGLDHWVLYGVREVLGPDSTGFGAEVDGHELQHASSAAVTTRVCTCAWFAAHGRAGGLCEHLLALELAVEACAQATARRGVGWRRCRS